MEKKRSVGVTIFGIICLLMSLAVKNMPLPGYDKITLFFAIVFFLCGIFILRLKNFARIILMIISVIWAVSILPFVLFAVACAHNSNIINILIFVCAYLLFPIGTIYFFTRPKVKEQFR